MCDYSLQNVLWRPAKVGDKLATHDFRGGTTGFAAPENLDVAVCVLSGTELAFSSAIAVKKRGFFRIRSVSTGQTMAVFRQINTNEKHRHHDALELPNGRTILLTMLSEGQVATVLQLPAEPKSPAKQVTREGAPARVIHTRMMK